METSSCSHALYLEVGTVGELAGWLIEPPFCVPTLLHLDLPGVRSRNPSACDEVPWDSVGFNAEGINKRKLD